MVIVAAFNVSGGWMYLTTVRQDAPLHPWETSSVLQIMPYKQHTQFTVLGTSHARSLTGCPASADALQQTLGAPVANLSKNSAGPVPLRLYLNEFYARGNSADTLIYFADPWTFYTPKWNEEHGFLVNEPFEPRFFVSCVLDGKSKRQLFQYVRMAFRTQTYEQNLMESNDCFAHLKQINAETVAHRNNHLLDRPPSKVLLDRYVNELDQLLNSACAHNTRIVIVTLPTLLGTRRGMDDFVAAMNDMAAKYNGHYFNFADSMQDTFFYIDHDHLNADGVAHFAEQYLRPALDKAQQ